MVNSTDYLLIEDALSMNSKMPLKQIYSCVVCTKDYFFVVPTKSIGTFVIFDTIKNHDFFNGLSIPEGLKRMANDAGDVGELEDKLKDLLENNENYIYDLNEAKSRKIKGFLGKKTLTYRKGMGWASFSPKTKADGKALAAFYEN